MTNINYIMDMAKSFLDGEIEIIDFYLDFPYEIEKRYLKMAREDREYAELIFDCLVEEGTHTYDELSEAQFKRLIRKQYKYIKDVASEGFILRTLNPPRFSVPRHLFHRLLITQHPI